MEHRTGATGIRVVTIMSTIARPLSAPFRFAQLRLPRVFGADRRRRQATIDLIHSSPHLLRDIGASEGMVKMRRP